ncbi:MAG TPA: cytosine permease [Actinomycetota bacterium]|nr:cytosine permease [Actinomycetota bacterium]
MATVTERLERALESEAPSWGISPVPPEHRRLSGLDFAVLWGDLSVGLLVLLTGALLVPSLGFPRALLAIVVGSTIGCIPLALVGLAGSREGVPGMVLFRPVLGVHGSYVPSVLNIVQLVGWTGFEFWAMGLVANSMLHVSYWFWLAVVAVVCTTLALGGPILVVRKWLERFGAWVVAGVAAWITIKVIATADLATVWHQPGTGGLPFWLAVDLVIAMPVSWLPLVADYNRFAKRGVSSAAGTYWGYMTGNVWFYALGALVVLGTGLSTISPGGLANAIAGLAGGWVVLLTLLVGETDEAFADIYSAAVSSQNLEGRINQRVGILAIAAGGACLAVWLGLRPHVAVGTYESFLFLLGSVFVPLFGVFVADYILLGRRGRLTADMFDRHARDDVVPRRRQVNVAAFSSWVIGFLIYQWSWTVPPGLEGWQTTMNMLFHRWLHLSYPLAGSRWGASIPAFLAALVIHAILSSSVGRKPGRIRTPEVTEG